MEGVRNIRELRNIPISQMNDMEILKATSDRLKTNAVMLVYDDKETNRWVFLSRYKAGNSKLIYGLKKVCETVFGKMKSF